MLCAVCFISAFILLDTFGPHTVHTPHEGIIRFAFLFLLRLLISFGKGDFWLLLTSVVAFKPVKCESESKKAKIVYELAEFIFSDFWLTLNAENWWKKCKTCASRSWSWNLCVTRDDCDRSEEEILLKWVQSSTKSPTSRLKLSSTKPQIQLLLQISSTETFIEQTEEKWLKWVLMERN